jgi:methionyl-tRNA formyltransferase
VKSPIVFFGSGAFGVPTLASLRERVAAIVTQPDRPAGRGGTLTPTPVAAWAALHAPEVPIFKPESVNAPDTVERIRGFHADEWVVIAFGQKLGKPLLADRFAINLHASLLPKWRGAAPIHAAMLAGDKETGNSVITLAEKMDAGLVLGQSTRAIDPLATAGELHDLLSEDGPALVQDVLAAHHSGTLKSVTQDESRVTLAPKLSRNDAWIDFARTSCVCRSRVHALSPWPGVQVSMGELTLKLLRVRDVGSIDAPPGTVLDFARGVIACGERSALELIEVQPVGKRAMSWTDFARGVRNMPKSMCASVVPVPKA